MPGGPDGGPSTRRARVGGWLRSCAARPPGPVFHLVCAPPAVWLLWSSSPPGGAFGLSLLSTLLLIVLATVWVLRVATFLVVSVRRRTLPSGRWLAVAPVCGLVVLGLLHVEVPMRVRWTASRPTFDDAAADVMRRRPSYESDRAHRLGLYRVTHVERRRDGVWFSEANGTFLGDAGFAYLPDGPKDLHDGLFGSTEVEALGGSWYAWTSGL